MSVLCHVWTWHDLFVERSDFPANSRQVGAGSLLLDRVADNAAPFGPRAVVDLDVRVGENLTQCDPADGRAMTQPAIADNVVKFFRNNAGRGKYDAKLIG